MQCYFTYKNVDVSSMQVYLPQSTLAFTTSLTEPFDFVSKYCLESEGDNYTQVK